MNSGSIVPILATLAAFTVLSGYRDTAVPGISAVSVPNKQMVRDRDPNSDQTTLVLNTPIRTQRSRLNPSFFVAMMVYGQANMDLSANGLPKAIHLTTSRSGLLVKSTRTRVQDCTFDDIKFPMEKGALFDRSLLSPSIKQLHGKRMRIRGYILPSFQQTGLTKFVLVRDNMECCFGPGAALYDCILVEMSAGKTTQFSLQPVAVEGRFEIQERLGPDGKHLAIYHLLADQVQ